MSTDLKTQSPVSPLAGKPAPKELLVDLSQLERAYYEKRPDVDNPNQLVIFGTSGHRGSSLHGTFNEAHILAITQAICEYRRTQGTDGPLYMGKDTHALSGPAQRTALEVLAANGVETIIQQGNGFTPTPVISHAILIYNRGRKDHLADGIVITPSHNPPEDGGFKYNPTNGGPADTDVTGWIENRANDLLRANNAGVKRVSYEAAIQPSSTRQQDFVAGYVSDLKNVVDLEIVRTAGLKLAVDPLGGASQPYWEPINSTYGLDVAIVNKTIDPTFSFMTVDHDGKIRMDCSSPYAMARLVGLKDQYDVAFGNDTDSDRHGIVTPSAGLLNPNHYLAVAIQYLLDISRAVVEERGCRQDAGQQQHDRSRRQQTGAEALGSSSGLQMVCPGFVRWLLLFRWRRERGREFPSPRRHGVDYRQRRPDHGPACRRDDRAHRQRSRRTLPRLGGRIRNAVLHAYRCRRHARAKNEAKQAVAGIGERVVASGRADHREADASSGQRSARLAG